MFFPNTSTTSRPTPGEEAGAPGKSQRQLMQPSHLPTDCRVSSPQAQS